MGRNFRAQWPDSANARHTFASKSNVRPSEVGLHFSFSGPDSDAASVAVPFLAGGCASLVAGRERFAPIAELYKAREGAFRADPRPEGPALETVHANIGTFAVNTHGGTVRFGWIDPVEIESWLAAQPTDPDVTAGAVAVRSVFEVRMPPEGLATFYFDVLAACDTLAERLATDFPNVPDWRAR